MVKELPKPPKAWHGIPRLEIPWFPRVDSDACIGCTLCFVTCGRGVYEMRDKLAVVAQAYECMVGCSTCATVCPVEAISFPKRELISRLEREHKIFKMVKQESAEKMAKRRLGPARAAAEEAIAKLVSRVKLEVAGEFGDKRFLIQLEELVKNRPIDIVDLELHVPTVRGAMEKAPAFMSFEVTSTKQEDIQDLLPELRTLIRENDLILVNETKA